MVLFGELIGVASQEKAVSYQPSAISKKWRAVGVSRPVSHSGVLIIKLSNNVRSWGSRASRTRTMRPSAIQCTYCQGFVKGQKSCQLSAISSQL